MKSKNLIFLPVALIVVLSVGAIMYNLSKPEEEPEVLRTSTPTPTLAPPSTVGPVIAPTVKIAPAYTVVSIATPTESISEESVVCDDVPLPSNLPNLPPITDKPNEIFSVYYEDLDEQFDRYFGKYVHVRGVVLSEKLSGGKEEMFVSAWRSPRTRISVVQMVHDDPDSISLRDEIAVVARLEGKKSVRFADLDCPIAVPQLVITSANVTNR